MSDVYYRTSDRGSLLRSSVIFHVLHSSHISHDPDACDDTKELPPDLVFGLALISSRESIRVKCNLYAVSF
ncbi:hypothetical protein CVT25_000577 [Psilocybe cyanescens]|uniref:Uncharacterized protein n=1 Tax=Psilocybe cyanescens TaxID=93625 RepID=A0A409WZZ4_PSICY|nr:hypothetical protein CVT25_000577 [Psilocybe cyanescens]